MKKKLIIILLPLVFIPLVCSAKPKSQEVLNNPGIAFAYPISVIVTDGDISDWPNDITHYPIERYYANPPKNKEDFEAYLQVGYNLSEQSIYFAVVVTDDSHVIDTTLNPGWDTQDTYSLYLDPKHLTSGSGVVAYQFNEKWRNLFNPSDSWDPEVKNATWNNVKIACKHLGTKTIYECKIILKGQIYPERSIGVDHIIMDKDSDDTNGVHSHITWGNDKWKDNTPGKLGYVVLMKSDESTGAVRGQIKWANDSVKGFPGKIRITSINNPSLWVETQVDSAGRYAVILSPDKFKISPVWSFWGIGDDLFKIDKKNSTILVTAKANKIVQAPPLIFKTIPKPEIISEKGILYDFNDKKAALLDKFIKTYQDYYDIPGISLAVIKDGKVVYHKTYGVKNTYTQEPVDENTLFEAASLTKPVFAFAVCRLAEKGIIYLDKPLYQYLPFKEIAYDERYKLITARHVLCHQTGFPNWRYENPDGKMDIKFTPGTGFGYSGEGYEYLKRIVAHITKKVIDEVLKEEVLNPLGLKNFYFDKNDYLAKVVANGHFDDLPTRAELPESPNMAASMYTEAKAFTTFMLALLNRKGLSKEMYDEMFKFQSTVPLDENEKKQGREIYFGLGIELEKTPFGLVFEHGGNNGDFKCQFKMFKDLNMGYVIFTNSNTGGQLAYNALSEFLITGKKKTDQ